MKTRALRTLGDRNPDPAMGLMASELEAMEGIALTETTVPFGGTFPINAYTALLLRWH